MQSDPSQAEGQEEREEAAQEEREEAAVDDNTPTEQSDSSRRLYIIDYADENERKRAEYTLKTWEDAEVERPNGTIRIVETQNQEGLMNQLMSRVPYDHIRAYELEDVEVSETVETVTLERELSAGRAGVETTLEFMISRRDGELVEPDENTYEVSEKGPARVTYSVEEAGAGNLSTVEIQISGAPKTTQYLLEQFRTELAQFEQNRTSR